jgi:hypothetical protein
MVFAEALWGELAEENVDVLGVLAPGMDTPCFRRNTAGTSFDTRGIVPHDPDEVVARALARLPYGPLLMFPMSPGAADMEPQIAERRARTIQAKANGRTFFPKAPA